MTTYKVLLRNRDGEIDSIIVNSESSFKAKAAAIEEYDRSGWYATEVIEVINEISNRQKT